MKNSQNKLKKRRGPRTQRDKSFIAVGMRKYWADKRRKEAQKKLDELWDKNAAKAESDFERAMAAEDYKRRKATGQLTPKEKAREEALEKRRHEERSKTLEELERLGLL